MAELPEVLALWFPLVPRARPVCLPIDERIEAVTSMVHRAGTAVEVAAALNLTALFASDIGDHRFAAEICRRQLSVFLASAPLDPEVAELAAEPVINLARLAIREGDGDRAYKVLEEALACATDAGRTNVDGVDVDFRAAAPDATARAALRKRLWIAMLSDGTRALTRAGRWSEALRSLRRRNGVGDRLLDGRQTAVISRIAEGDLVGARDLIARSEAIEPWEQAVKAFLELCCNRKGSGIPIHELESLILTHQHLALPPEQRLFGTRMGLSILELAHSVGFEAHPLAQRLAKEVLTDGDAYAARDLLHHSDPGLIETDLQGSLMELIGRAGIGHEAPSRLHRQQFAIVADVGIDKLSRRTGQDPR